MQTLVSIRICEKGKTQILNREELGRGGVAALDPIRRQNINLLVSDSVTRPNGCFLCDSMRHNSGTVRVVIDRLTAPHDFSILDHLRTSEQIVNATTIDPKTI